MGCRCAVICYLGVVGHLVSRHCQLAKRALDGRCAFRSRNRGRRRVRADVLRDLPVGVHLARVGEQLLERGKLHRVVDRARGHPWRVEHRVLHLLLQVFEVMHDLVVALDEAVRRSRCSTPSSTRSP